MLTSDELLPFMPNAYCCAGFHGRGCVCGDVERVLRFIAAGEAPPLTGSARAALLAEIASFEEPSEPDPDGDDAELAQAVLDTWATYARGQS